VSGARLTEVTLRPMRWWDVAAAAALEPDLFPAAPWTAAGFWSELAGVPQTRYYVVAEDGTDLVGYAGLFVVGPEADVQTVAVRGDRQGAGLGRVLVEDLLDEARRRGCAQVLLEVREDNAAARHLYDRLGFEQVAVRRGYYGPGRDAVVMRLRLAPAGSGDPT
jgi:[ribosomal protein S18]-alanine N-acetyltransferase